MTQELKEKGKESGALNLLSRNVIHCVTFLWLQELPGLVTQLLLTLPSSLLGKCLYEFRGKDPLPISAADFLLVLPHKLSWEGGNSEEHWTVRGQHTGFLRPHSSPLLPASSNPLSLGWFFFFLNFYEDAPLSRGKQTQDSSWCLSLICPHVANSLDFVTFGWYLPQIQKHFLNFVKHFNCYFYTFFLIQNRTGRKKSGTWIHITKWSKFHSVSN